MNGVIGDWVSCDSSTSMLGAPDATTGMGMGLQSATRAFVALGTTAPVAPSLSEPTGSACRCGVMHNKHSSVTTLRYASRVGVDGVCMFVF
jgi:hypothetical protein